MKEYVKLLQMLPDGENANWIGRQVTITLAGLQDWFSEYG